MKLNFGYLMSHCWTMDWLESQTSERVYGLLWHATTNIEQQYPLDFMSRRVDKVNRFLPSGWHIKQTLDKNIILTVPDEVWHSAVVKYQEDITPTWIEYFKHNHAEF